MKNAWKCVAITKSSLFQVSLNLKAKWSNIYEIVALKLYYTIWKELSKLQKKKMMDKQRSDNKCSGELGIAKVKTKYQTLYSKIGTENECILN